MRASTVTNDQRRCLAMVYEHFHRDGVWPRMRDLQRRLANEGRSLDVRAAIESLPPGHGTHWGADGEVSLTARGIFAVVPDAEELRDLVAAVELGVARFAAIDTEPKLSRGDLLAMGMDAGRARRCYVLLKTEPFVLAGGSEAPDGDWHFQLSDEIWRLKGVESVTGYFDRDGQIRSDLGRGVLESVPSARVDDESSKPDLSALDHSTLDALADVICDDGGPAYRKGWQLPGFFRRAGVESPEFGGTRKWWVLDRLSEYAVQPGSLDKIVRRLADPREYNGDAEIGAHVLGLLNEALRVEGVQVEIDGIVPRLRSARPQLVEAKRQSEAPLPPPDFSRITDDGALQAVLKVRWTEAQRCVEVGAYLSAIVMMGSVLEGSLVAYLRAHPEEAMRSHAAPRDDARKARPMSQWTLAQMIAIAHEREWIERDVKDFGGYLRDYRNLVHPAEQAKQGFHPDRDTCAICWATVQAAVNDLLRVR